MVLEPPVKMALKPFLCRATTRFAYRFAAKLYKKFLVLFSKRTLFLFKLTIRQIPIYLTTLAGTPTAVASSGMSHKTTAFAPIFTLFPISILPSIFAPAPTKTPL